jgi:hypothetical protein
MKQDKTRSKGQFTKSDEHKTSRVIAIANLHHRARCNGFALQGKYSAQMENRKISV